MPRIQGHWIQTDSLQNSNFSWLNDIFIPLSICTWFLRFSSWNFDFDKLDWMFYHKISLPHDPKNHWLDRMLFNHVKLLVWNASIWVQWPCTVSRYLNFTQKQKCYFGFFSMNNLILRVLWILMRCFTTQFFL